MEDIKILGLFYLIIEMIKFLYPFVARKESLLSRDEQYMIRKMNDQQKALLSTIEKVSDTQKEISHILERILDKLQERELRK